MRPYKYTIPCLNCRASDSCLCKCGHAVSLLMKGIPTEIIYNEKL